MNKLFFAFAAIMPGVLTAQIYNKGANIYTQKGAYIHVEGALVNASGDFKNDGIIEINGNFENSNGAGFGVYNDPTSTDRAVKFIGNGTQTIKGNMSSPNASFYNLVIDKAQSSDAVEMQTGVKVDGSLVFGTTTTTSTYNPSAYYTNNNQKGLIKTYTDNNEYLMTIANGDAGAIAGYATMQINGAPSTAYILTKGNRGSADGGLQRKVEAATSYDFPIGTADKGFNAVRINLNHVPATGGFITGKFNNGSSSTTGAAGIITQQCTQCDGNGYINPGYNRYFEANPCNNSAPQWLILENSVIDHGYWSFAADDSNNAYTYSVEVFPNSFHNLGVLAFDQIRTVKFDASYGTDPSAMVWNTNIEDVTNITDLLTYTKNAGCYAGDGIPGGEYNGMSAHFSLKGAGTSNALPVKIISLTAQGRQSSIDVMWATAIEINNRGFEVKRSEDGINFTTIGWVNGSNNSTSEKQYAYNDNTVKPNVVYYYKLNQVDFDGAGEESNIVYASIGKATDAITVSEPMPNPAHNASSLMVSFISAQPVTVKLFDMIGREVSASTFELKAGDNNLSLDLSAFSSGTYNAVLYTGEKTFSKKLTVSNN